MSGGAQRAQHSQSLVVGMRLQPGAPLPSLTLENSQGEGTYLAFLLSILKNNKRQFLQCHGTYAFVTCSTISVINSWIFSEFILFFFQENWQGWGDCLFHSHSGNMATNLSGVRACQAWHQERLPEQDPRR